MFASAGYVVFMPNPRGSTGWGQAFTDDINGDWGGKAYEDVMKGTDFALALPGVDATRTAAAGASFGGYMIDWIAGHSDRFKALVTHDGVFDLVSMYGSTEELWFPEWELGGPYWSHPEGYTRHNPRDFVKNFKTPTLVIHGERDYRVPLEQSLGDVHGAPAPGRSRAALDLPRREPLGAQALELGSLVLRGGRLARPLDQALRASLADGSLAYDDRGRGEPLLLLHAFPLDRSMWEAQAEALASDQRVIAFDARGFGESPLAAGPLTMEGCADDAAALLDRLGIERAVVGGCSMGGYAALAFARRHPRRLRALYLQDTRAGADSEDARRGRAALAERVLREGPAVVVEALLPKLVGETTKREQPALVARLRSGSSLSSRKRS